MVSPQWRWRLERWRNQLRQTLRQLFGRSQAKPRLCPSCGLLVGAQEKVCSHCGASMAALSFTSLKRIALAIIPEETPVSYTLLIANIVFFIIPWILSLQRGATSPFAAIPSDIALRFGAKHGFAIRYLGEYWRLVMPIFLHANLLHLAFNSLVLYQIGPQVEALFGSRRFIFFYLTCGVFGFLASTWWYPPAFTSVGSSGALFGLVGVMISYLSQRSFAREYRTAFIRWAIFILLLGILFPFDNAAHLGGLLSGLVLGRIVSDRRPATPTQQFTVWLMGWGAAVIILISLAMTLLHLRPTS